MPSVGAPAVRGQVQFLPLNVTGPEGDGSVNYTVKAKPTAYTGDVVDAKATIVFDVNPPIDTPAIFDTVDAGLPTSAVAALTATTNGTTFGVTRSGQDDADASGLAAFDVYVSEDGMPYTLWLGKTTLTAAAYAGRRGHAYRFYTLATDNAGNVEAAPAVADAVTVVAPSKVLTRSIFYNNSALDGNDPAASAADDAAVATGKRALLPGQAATFANYTSYSKGINGIEIDLTTVDPAIGVADFTFRVGNGGNPATWAAGPAPLSITVRKGGRCQRV